MSSLQVYQSSEYQKYLIRKGSFEIELSLNSRVYIRGYIYLVSWPDHIWIQKVK